MYIAAYWPHDLLTESASIESLQLTVDQQDDPRNLMITYNKRGVYTCRVCNVVSCTDKTVTVNELGRRVPIEIFMRIHKTKYAPYNIFRKMFTILI